MIKLKKILYESLLKEALPLSVAKRYASIEQNPSIKKKLDEIFNKLKGLPNAKSSKRGERVYIPYEMSDLESETRDEIENVISKQGYKVKDYVKGIASDKYGRDMKIGKVLSKLKQPNLLNAFNADMARASANVNDFLAVFSRHSYDIAGMSTDRDWTSCMNIYKGENRHYINYDVVDGSFIVYLIKTIDSNVNKPIGRVLVRPYVQVPYEKDDGNQQGDVVLYSTSASNLYGNPPSGFKDFVENVLRDIQGSKIGKFRLKSGLYCDIRGGNKKIVIPNEYKTKEAVDVFMKYVFTDNVDGSYIINSDLSVTINGNFTLNGNARKGETNEYLDGPDLKLPIKIREINGDFHVIGMSFRRFSTNFPNKVTGDVKIGYMDNLRTLEGIPSFIGGELSIYECDQLRSLKGCPERVKALTLSNTSVISLEGSPREVDIFLCQNNIFLNSLEGGPKVNKLFGGYNVTDKDMYDIDFIKNGIDVNIFDIGYDRGYEKSRGAKQQMMAYDIERKLRSNEELTPEEQEFYDKYSEDFK